MLEIDLLENELVTVLSKHDEGGNEGEIISITNVIENKQLITYFFPGYSEWWLVENDSGAQGYAPAAYLTKWPQTL